MEDFYFDFFNFTFKMFRDAVNPSKPGYIQYASHFKYINDFFKYFVLMSDNFVRKTSKVNHNETTSSNRKFSSKFGKRYRLQRSG